MTLRLNQLMGKRLLCVFAVAFVVAVAGVWLVQGLLVQGKSNEMQESNRRQLCIALTDASEGRLMSKVRRAAGLLPEKVTGRSLRKICFLLKIDELHVVDTNGVIVHSTVPEFLGYVMADHEQSRPFCKLLTGELEELAQDFGQSGYSDARSCKYVAVRLPRGGFLQAGLRAEGFLPETDFGSLLLWPIVMTGGILLLVFVVVFLIVFAFFRERIVAPIRLANASLAKIASGNLDEKVRVGGSTEMDALAEDINVTVDRLKGYIDEAAHRADAEMAMAKSIQANVLPANFPPYPNLVDRFDIFARMITAKEVGGDFYDFYFAGRGKLALAMADVSGKGVPAALFMMRAKATVQGLLKGGLDVCEAVTAANDRLSEANDANMFVTAWIGVIDIETGALEYVNAGHNPPLVKRADGSVAYLTEKSGPPLAAMAGAPYRKQSVVLGPGDAILLSTDGVTEALNPAQELYGEDRLQKTLQGLVGSPSTEAVLQGVIDSIHAFAAGAEQADDITLLGFKRK